MKTQWLFSKYAPSRKEYVKQEFNWMSPLEQLFLTVCDKGDDTALRLAAEHRHLSVVDYLIGKGADISSKLGDYFVEKILVPLIGYQYCTPTFELWCQQYKIKQFKELQKLNRIHFEH